MLFLIYLCSFLSFLVKERCPLTIASFQDKTRDLPVVMEVLKSCGCLQYENILLSEGFDRLESLVALEKDDLTALGMSEREGDLIRRAAEKMVKGRKK